MNAETGGGRGGAGKIVAGRGTQAMAIPMLAIQMTALILLLVAVLAYAKHLRIAVPSGLPATVILAIGIYLVANFLRERTGEAGRSAASPSVPRLPVPISRAVRPGERGGISGSAS